MGSNVSREKLLFYAAAGGLGGFAMPPDHDRGNQDNCREAYRRKNNQPAGPVTGFQRSHPIDAVLCSTSFKPRVHLLFHYLIGQGWPFLATMPCRP